MEKSLEFIKKRSLLIDMILIVNEGFRLKYAGDMFQRMNIGTNRELLKEAYERMEKAINNIRNIK